MLLFLYGEDLFRSKEKLNELKQKFIEKNASSSVLTFDFSEKTANERDFLESLRASGLFSERKLIIVLDFLKNVPTEIQKSVLESLKKTSNLENDQDLIVIFYESSEPKKNLSFFKYLHTKAKKQSFPLLQGFSLSNWAEEYAKKISPEISFSKNTLELLVSYTGNNLYLLKNELEKLVAFKQQGEITQDDVNQLVKAGIQSTVFEAIEALFGGNKGKALSLLHQQLEKGEDPFYMLSMYIYQIRTLLKISSAYQDGNTSAPMIAKQTGLHPFVAQKSLSQIRNISLEKLKNIYKELEKIDFQSKTGKESLILLLDKFIASI
ncbi:MAG: hypothetical protein ACD_11C00116G0007 [uncultured bacterium]|nr:MAG: hypothetical protein ACD_11C00116G0007 [uncultured bacterium]HBR71249.1 DNA polymerase III subunit delta [Candidatus Moranbacteria bacterium]